MKPLLSLQIQLWSVTLALHVTNRQLLLYWSKA